MLKLVLVVMVTVGGSMFGLKLSANSLVPIVVTRSNNGERGMDIFSRLLESRIVRLDSVINAAVASIINAQLLYLNGQNPDEDIQLHINSPGGEVYAGLSIYDTMQAIKADVCTTGSGLCASMGAFLLLSGAKGKRRALQNTTAMIHQPHVNRIGGQATDVEIQAEEILRLKERMIEIMAQHTGQDPERIRADIERDNFMSAEAALEYGLIDEITERE